MEPVGAFSAILTIAAEFLHVSKDLRRCFRTLKYAKKDVEAIYDEVEPFSTLLSMFHDAVTDDRFVDDDILRQRETSDIAQHIVTSGRRALDRIDDILARLDPLRIDRDYTTLQQWYAHWRWFMRKEDWSPICTLLNSIKTSAILLMAILHRYQLLQKFEQLHADQGAIPNELLQQLSLNASQVKTMLSSCKKTERECRKNARECKRMQVRQEEMLRMTRELVALAFHLTQSHIASHPELEAVLGRRGLASFVPSDPTTSRNSGSSGRRPTRPPKPSSPRGPRSGPSSRRVPVHKTPSATADNPSVPVIPLTISAHPPAAENPTPPPHLPGSDIPSGQAVSSGRSSPDSESDNSGTASPRSTPANKVRTWVPTAIVGPPEPSIRPANPRRSDGNLSERPVIVDDGQGIREEFRRPRRPPGLPHAG
ncbi:uncharacterized protein PV07_02748 [Cladophialophora immunda]|uniref:Fungal N-terminal domain-containing protein n=1 Tax=Cladophialophora immunda TaxID=569365 RepID=A0A0D2CM06_9EURO|nr:uncharacterized protein PV07_02748 [Cladophialophora immunda]KIW31065.1 hypothetical protein PV07_02748 [Cladophialophora immunda]